MASHVLSVRLKPEQMERLQRLARRADRKPSELAARLLEESLRMAEFPQIEFRDSTIGRQAYIKGHRLTVWMLAWIARAYGDDAERTAGHLAWPTWLVEAGLGYYRAFSDEIDPVIADHEASDFETLRRDLPDAKVFTARRGHGTAEPATSSTPSLEGQEDASAAVG